MAQDYPDYWAEAQRSGPQLGAYMVTSRSADKLRWQARVAFVEKYDIALTQQDNAKTDLSIFTGNQTGSNLPSNTAVYSAAGHVWMGQGVFPNHGL